MKNSLLKPAPFLQHSFLRGMHSHTPSILLSPLLCHSTLLLTRTTPITSYSPYILCIRLTNELLKGRNMIYSPLCAIFSVRTQYLEHRSLINVCWLKYLTEYIHYDSVDVNWWTSIYLSQQIPFDAKLSFLDSWIERPTFYSHFLSKI